jgi:hypothetical protein
VVWNDLLEVVTTYTYALHGVERTDVASGFEELGVDVWTVFGVVGSGHDVRLTGVERAVRFVSGVVSQDDGMINND